LKILFREEIVGKEVLTEATHQLMFQYSMTNILPNLERTEGDVGILDFPVAGEVE
jgi:hypothetical protein